MTGEKIPSNSEYKDGETKPVCQCSAYNKLTRKCLCLNQTEYNDFVLHFNDCSKYRTSDLGEVIKNMRMLKKFMYMSCAHTRNALKFLIDGLSNSKDKEKVEIIEGCSHADICNIFEEYSIVFLCITWPWRSLHYGDCFIQVQAANLLLKLAEVEEGKKYLNLNSKISSDIKTITRKRSSHLEPKTVELLNATMCLLKTPISLNNYSEPETSSEVTGSITTYNKIQMLCKAQNTCAVKRQRIIPVFTD